MSRPFASRALTIITAEMLDHARQLDGQIVAARSRCGRYWTFQAVSGVATDPALVVLDGRDVPQLAAQYGGPANLGVVARNAFLATVE